jgi:DNA-binding NtrC family response regulator
MKTGTIAKNEKAFTYRASHRASASPAKTVKVNVLCPLAAGNIKSLAEGQPSALSTNSRQEDLERSIFEIFIDLVCHKHPLCLRHVMETIEAGIIKHILDETHGSQKKTAKVLGLKYTTLNMKVKKYHIQEAEETLNLFAPEEWTQKSRSEH